jgi:hypothetical protein
MARAKQSEREKKLKDAMEILHALGFAPKQSNEVAGYTLLALLDLKPGQSWSEAAAPLRGITPIIESVATAFANRHAMRTFFTQLSWETEVWIAEDPDHLIHFNGERYLGPYPDVLPLS